MVVCFTVFYLCVFVGMLWLAAVTHSADEAGLRLRLAEVGAETVVESAYPVD